MTADEKLMMQNMLIVAVDYGWRSCRDGLLRTECKKLTELVFEQIFGVDLYDADGWPNERWTTEVKHGV